MHQIFTNVKLQAGNGAETLRNCIFTEKSPVMPLGKPDEIIFCTLFREAYHQCFKQDLKQPLTETEGKLFYQQILEHTGLTVGWRSLKNYSFHVLKHGDDKQENPSVATLDTLARYVLKAPYTNDVKRKQEDDHHPYWFLYREQALTNSASASTNAKTKKGILIPLLFLVVCLPVVSTVYWLITKPAAPVNENFLDVSDSKLTENGWLLSSKNATYWNKRAINKNSLTLFTLNGDNWPDSAAAPVVQNLLYRKLPAQCFNAELHFEGFIPGGRWQQAGILLMQDTDINSPCIRVSLAYNDNFGGYNRPKEILVQAISAPGNGRKPEEFAHYTVLAIDSAAKTPLLKANLTHSALRVEKVGDLFRILYSGGVSSNTAFKEVVSQRFTFEPRYIGIFALKGFKQPSSIMPVKISGFILEGADCR
jgi:hypothetical protein